MNHFKQMNMYANKTITMQKHNNLTLAAWRAAGQIRQTDLSHHAARNAWNCKWRRTSFRFYRAQIYPFGFSSHASNERVWCIHKRVTGPLLTSITPRTKVPCKLLSNLLRLLYSFFQILSQQGQTSLERRGIVMNTFIILHGGG